MINYLIIDDERLAREELSLLMKPYYDFAEIGQAADAEKGMELIEQLQPDMIFLDIQMPGKTGFEMLEALSDTPIVIFTTAYDQYAIRAFEYNALDYILKPIRQERMHKTILKVKQDILNQQSSLTPTAAPHQQQQIFIKDGEQCHFIHLKDVFLIESIGNYAKFYFNNQTALLHRSLAALEKKLDPLRFFRINRKEIINAQHIEKIVPMFKGSLRITLSNGQEVEVSERRSVKFKELMSL